MKLCSVLIAVTLPATVLAQSDAIDQQRSAWKFRRTVTVPSSGAPGDRLVALPLPPELHSAAQSDLRDLRLIGADGRETPFIIDRQTDRVRQGSWVFSLVDMQTESNRFTTFTGDLHAQQTFDRLELNVPQQNFAKRVRIETSLDNINWTLITDSAGIFDQVWNSVRTHHTSIELSQPASARYVRLTIDDSKTAPVRVQGLTAISARPIAGPRWEKTVSLDPADGPSATSRYRLDLPAAVAFDQIQLQADDIVFNRPVRIIEERQISGEPNRRILVQGNLYRVKLADALISGENLTLTTRPPAAGNLFFEIDNADSPPLRNVRLTVSGLAVRLIFPVEAAGASAQNLTLYYGNDATRAPYYDIQSLHSQLGLNTDFLVATLGLQSPNPRYEPVPPMQFVATVGAAIETRLWSHQHKLSVPAAEDIYTFTLPVRDLAVLRPDYADIRIADSAGRQIPYILEPDAGEDSLTLRIEKDPRAPRPNVSRYVFHTPESVPVPVNHLHIFVQDGFFNRPSRLYVIENTERGERERVLHSAALTRAAGQQAPLRLPAGNARADRFILEIDEGDNAPLNLFQVTAISRVPRVAFKLKPDGNAYRVLLGNRNISAPRYDLQSLQREVLAYSAVPIAAGELEANPAHRRLASEYFKSAPPTILMWGVLLIAVAGLLLLTVRLLKKPASPN
jgi:hypothetical protein